MIIYKNYVMWLYKTHINLEKNIWIDFFIEFRFWVKDLKIKYYKKDINNNKI